MSDEIDEILRELDDEFNDMVDILSSDIHLIGDQLNAQDIQVWRRALYRTVFAFIEGINSCFKKDVLLSWSGIIGEDTKLLLQDLKSITDNEGNPRIVRSFQPFGQNLDFAFETYAWTSGSSFVIDKNSSGWKSLIAANKVRNRIVHPKNPSDLTISDEEMDILRVVKQWYGEQVQNLFKSASKALLDELQAFKKADRFRRLRKDL